MRGWILLHLAPLASITKHTGYLVRLVFHRIINWVALEEPMSSSFIHNISKGLLGLYLEFSWLPIICSGSLTNFPCRNILRDSFLETGGIVFHLLQVCLRHCRPYGKVCPRPISVQIWNPPRQPPYIPMVNNAQRLPNLRGHDPRFRPVEEHHLNYCMEMNRSHWGQRG